MATFPIALSSGVFSDFTGSISAMNTISTWVASLVRFAEACGEAKHRISDLQRDVDFCREDLSQWRRQWKLERLTTIRWHRELWGEKVSQINLKVLRIQERCVRFREEFDGVFQPEVSTFLERAIANDQPTAQWRAVEAYRQALSQDISGETIIRFVRRLDGLGTTWVKDMKTWFADLVETANTAFRDQWGETVTGSPTEAQLRRVAESTLVQLALEIRNASEGLYKQLWSAAMERQATHPWGIQGARKSTKLKIDLTGTMDWYNIASIHHKRTISLIYHLVLQWDVEPREMCIEGPMLVDNHARAGGVLDAYVAALATPGQAPLPYVLVDDGMEGRFFRSFLPCEGDELLPHALNPITMKKFLKNHLGDLDSISCGRIFPPTERIDLAFKFIESAFLLAGTPWLSNVGSDSLRRFQSRGNKYNYTVDLDREYVEWESVGQLSAQIFRVGLILAEIGSAKQVVGIKQDKVFNILKFKLDRVKEEVTIDTLKKHIDPTLGEPYVKMTSFCLQEQVDLCVRLREEDPSGVDAAYKRILEEYFREVYVP
jgi:hypothetical protein